MKEHIAPWECTYAKEEKNKCKPGKKPKSEHEYFEILCLCILQAGLSWKMVRKNWQKYRKGFYNFNADKLSKTGAKELMKRKDVIKNEKKIRGIIYNAREFAKIKKEYGSFQNFLKTLKQMKEKELLLLLSNRFRHVGDYTAEFYLHSIGYFS